MLLHYAKSHSEGNICVFFYFEFKLFLQFSKLYFSNKISFLCSQCFCFNLNSKLLALLLNFKLLIKSTEEYFSGCSSKTT